MAEPPSPSMNALMQDRLSTLETALTTLTDSIAAYNPSIPAAHALLEADDALQASVQTLYKHQKNHAKILQLRAVIERQNTQITNHLTALAETRAILLSIPNSLPKEGRREVAYEELLGYAARIGRNTAPLSMRAKMGEVQTAEKQREKEGAMSGVEDAKDGGSGGKQEGIGLESLLRTERLWLDQSTGVAFTPWPSEEVIKRSALAQVQAINEGGGEVGGGGDEGVDDVMMEGSGETGGGGGNGAIKGDVGGANDPGVRVEKREERQKVFGGLDLYDPDEEQV